MRTDYKLMHCVTRALKPYISVRTITYVYDLVNLSVGMVGW